MTKAKKWKIAIIVLLGFVATVLIAIGEGRFGSINGTIFQMVLIR